MNKQTKEEKIKEEVKNNIIPKSFYVLEKGAKYELPVWKINETGIEPTKEVLEIPFLKRERKASKPELLKSTDNFRTTDNESTDNESTERKWIDNVGNEFWIDSMNFLTEDITKQNIDFVILDKKEDEFYVKGTDQLIDETNLIEYKDEKGNVVYLSPVHIKTVTLETQKGVLVQTILSMLIEDLKFKHKEVPSRENNIAITKLEEAQMWLETRTKDRINKGVINSYKK